MRTHALRKVFLSIKGVYFQAEVMGQTITWLVPYQFTQPVHSLRSIHSIDTNKNLLLIYRSRQTLMLESC